MISCFSVSAISFCRLLISLRVSRSDCPVSSSSATLASKVAKRVCLLSRLVSKVEIATYWACSVTCSEAMRSSSCETSTCLCALCASSRLQRAVGCTDSHVPARFDAYFAMSQVDCNPRFLKAARLQPRAHKLTDLQVSREVRHRSSDFGHVSVHPRCRIRWLSP